MVGVMLRVPQHDGQEAKEREQATRQREQEELDRRIPPLFASPNADQKEQRDQRELEEDVEQDNVAGRKDSQAAEFEQQQHRVKQGGSLFNRFPAHQDGRHKQQRRQAEEPNSQSIEADAK